MSYRRDLGNCGTAREVDAIFSVARGTIRRVPFREISLLPAAGHISCTFGEQKAPGSLYTHLHPGTEKLRILFALTVALGVATPTLTSTTAKSVGHHMDDVVPQLRRTEPQPAPPLAPMSLADIEGHVGKLASLKAGAASNDASTVAKTEKPAAQEIEEPAATDHDDDDLAVTTPIEQVCEALADAAIAHGLPVGFFARLIWQESRFDQWARSHAGAQGLAQFMPPTAAEFGLRDPFDPIQSVSASARFLRQLRDQFGNLGLAAAAYNAGGGRIRKWLNGQSAMPEETRNYVSIITGHPPKRWTVRKPLEISFALPRRAPCDGVEGLSRNAAASQHDVKLTELASELIAEAEAARRAKIAAARAARNKRYAAARGTKGSRKAAVTKVAATSKGKVRVAMATAK
jgi:hypothetical protein